MDWKLELVLVPISDVDRANRLRWKPCGERRPGCPVRSVIKRDQDTSACYRLGGSSRSKILPNAADNHHLVEAECAVCRGTHGVLHQRVRSELAAPQGQGPRLGRRHERAPYPLPPSFGNDVPAFEEADRAGLAALGIGSARDLGEAHKLVRKVVLRGHKNGLRHGPEPGPRFSEEPGDLGRV